MDNLARNISITTNDDGLSEFHKTKIVNKYGKRWHYIDLKEFESQIRFDEQRKQIIRNKEKRLRKRQAAEKRKEMFIRSIIPRCVGAIIVLLTLALCRSGLFIDPKTGLNDCTFALVAIPFGLLFIFLPSRYYGDDNNDIDKTD